MTTNHIDQLAQWYADAERITGTSLPRDGDTLIFPYNAGGYAIVVEEDDWTPDDLVPGEPVRILSRAPKPKPAWHDALAVIAHTDYFERQVWERESDGTYSGSAGDVEYGYDLRDVTPLIEAKVTDEMRDRVRDYYRAEHHVELPRDDVWLNDLLSAALGLETE